MHSKTMTGGYTMKENNIRELAERMGLISVENVCQYTIAQLVYMVANKVNELINEVWRFETDVHETLKTQNENIQYLLDEGLHLEVEDIFNGWVKDGTFDVLINQSALKKVNERIDETNAQLSDKASKRDLAVESARIDNLMRMEEGSTTGDAELADIRVGTDKIYRTAGDSVRGQLSNIKNALDHELKYVLGNNIFNKNEVTEGYRVNPDSGEIVVSVSKWVTDYIQVKPKEELVFLAKNSSKMFEYYGLEYVFYDMRGGVVNFGELSRQTDEQYLTVPSGCYFVKISSNVDLTTDIIFGSRKYWVNPDFAKENYEEYTEPYYKLKEVYATEKDFELSDKKNTGSISTLKDGVNVLKNGLEHEFEYITPLNLLDKSKITENTKVNPTNGNVEPSSSRCVSDYIKIKVGDELVYLGQSSSGTFKYYQYEYVFYNESKEILSYGLLETSDTEQFITTPKDAYFVRISFGLAVDRGMIFGLKSYWSSPEFAKENYEEYTSPYYKLKGEFLVKEDLKDFIKETSAGVPDYWQEEVDRIVGEINLKFEQGMREQNQMFGFFFSSDNHYTSVGVTNNSGNADVSSDLMKYIGDNSGIVLNINGGDLLEDRTARTVELSRKAKQLGLKDLRYFSKRLASATPVFLTTQGNHDDNCQNASFDSDGTAYRFEERAIYGKEWAKECVSPYSYSNMRVGASQKYYYLDDDFNKVRIVCVDCMEGDYRIPLDESKGTVNSRQPVITDQQIEWVKNDVLASLPTGFSVLFFSHVSPVKPNVRTLDGGSSDIGSIVPGNNDKLLSVINEFKTNGGTIIGYFTGHIHYDTITKSNGVNYIQILNDGLFEKNFTSRFNVNQPEKRVLGTTNECAFDVVIVNQTTKHVDIFRVGAGNDRGFDY